MAIPRKTVKATVLGVALLLGVTLGPIAATAAPPQWNACRTAWMRRPDLRRLRSRGPVPYRLVPGRFTVISTIIMGP